MIAQQAKTITRVLIVGTVVLWIAWDIVAVLTGGPWATESATIRSWMDLHPAFPWGVGFILVGHFAWQVKSDPPSNWWTRLRTVLVFPIVALAVLTLDVLGLEARWLASIGNPGGAVLPLAIGAVCGRLLWPQDYDPNQG